MQDLVKNVAEIALACEHALGSCQLSFSFIFNFSYILDTGPTQGLLTG